MLFDEPLNNLDIRHAVDMMRLLRDAARDFGKTVVVVLHDINFASCYSNHIVVMRGGKVMLQGARTRSSPPKTCRRSMARPSTSGLSTGSASRSISRVKTAVTGGAFTRQDIDPEVRSSTYPAYRSIRCARFR